MTKNQSEPAVTYVVPKGTSYERWLALTRENAAYFQASDTSCSIPWPFLLRLISERDEGQACIEHLRAQASASAITDEGSTS